MANFAKRLWERAVHRKEGTPVSQASSGPTVMDPYGIVREPTKRDLLKQYKSLVYACANINARAVASQKLRMYVATGPGQQPTKRWATRSLKPYEVKRIQGRSDMHWSKEVRKAVRYDEVLEHPALDLIASCNQFMDGFSLFELTDLAGEIQGTGYWYVPRDALGVPEAIWYIPPHEMSPSYDADGMITHYEYGWKKKRFELEDIISFPFPNPMNPYGEGMSPLRAAYEDALLMSKQSSHQHATMDNRGRPDIILAPKDLIGEEEAKRLEKKYNQKFRRGGQGGVMVMESSIEAKPFTFNSNDLQLAQMKGLTKSDIANIYDVPISLLETKDVNRANADAGHYQHAKLAVSPRCQRVENRLNAGYAPMWDARLFFMYDDPIPQNVEQDILVREKQLGTGQRTINELREQDGLGPVPWGNEPWLPVALAQPGSDVREPVTPPNDDDEDL